MAKSLTNQDSRYATDIVEKICKEVGPGVPGSPQERERAGVIKREMESHLGAGISAADDTQPGEGLSEQLAREADSLRSKS